MRRERRKDLEKVDLMMFICLKKLFYDNSFLCVNLGSLSLSLSNVINIAPRLLSLSRCNDDTIERKGEREKEGGRNMKRIN
jgi:hypothetical protein